MLVEELRRKIFLITAGRDLDTTLTLFLHPLHLCGAAHQAEILGVASRTEMADIEQIKNVVPFIMREITFGQDVCDLVFGVNVTE